MWNCLSVDFCKCGSATCACIVDILMDTGISLKYKFALAFLSWPHHARISHNVVRDTCMHSSRNTRHGLGSPSPAVAAGRCVSDQHGAFALLAGDCRWGPRRKAGREVGE